MPPSVKYMDLPFDEAIDFFRQKVKLPTRAWNDLWQGMHSRAFVVAGAMQTDLLCDLYSAIDKAISEGTTLNEFRKSFDDTVARNGWAYKGGRGWRTSVIYNTNLSVAYSTGHWKRMTDPDMLKARPYLRYVASSARERRPEHMQWYNVVLPADDPFWRKHTPPNDWGCKCGIVSQSAREVERLKKEEADGEYPVTTASPRVRYYEWTDKTTGEVHRVPEGIGPGWDYNPGEAAWGRRLTDESMAAWQAQGAGQWTRLTPGGWESSGRPEMIPADRTATKAGRMLNTVPAAQRALEKILGGPEKGYSLEKNKFRYDLVVNAESLAQHMDLNRTAFLPYLPETLEDPYEVWLSFERHKGSGKVVLRQRVIKAVQMDKSRAMLAVFQSKNGWMEAWTVVPSSDLKYINAQRSGKLIWKREG